MPPKWGFIFLGSPATSPTTTQGPAAAPDWTMAATLYVTPKLFTED